jgi:hypothetical protein
MLKKILVSTVLIGLIGILVIGALNRTQAKAETSQARGQGRGQNAEHLALDATDQLVGQGLGSNAQSNGRGGQGGSGGMAERQYRNSQAAPAEWQMYEGSVVQVPESGVDLVIETDTGEELVIGTGPSYISDQGFALGHGERIQVSGYWEGSEFKAAQITCLSDGQTLTLRNETGQPAWAGAGRNAQNIDRDGNGGQGRQNDPGDRTGSGEAEVNEWLLIEGTVASVDENTLVVQTAADTQVRVENRAWWFAQEQGFSAQSGDQVTLTGFYDGADLTVGRIENATSNQTVLIRDETGRPLWAGRGRGGA